MGTTLTSINGYTIINLVTSIFVYTIVPILLRLKRGHSFSKRDSFQIALANSIFFSIAFIVFRMELEIKPAIQTFNPGFLYYFINYQILFHKNKNIEDESLKTQEEKPDLPRKEAIISVKKDTIGTISTMLIHNSSSDPTIFNQGDINTSEIENTGNLKSLSSISQKLDDVKDNSENHLHSVGTRGSKIDINQDETTSGNIRKPYFHKDNEITKKVDNAKVMFCKVCGNEIDSDGVCVGCGKKYFRIKGHNKIHIASIAVILVLIGAFIYQSNYYTNYYNEKIRQSEMKIELLRDSIKNLQEIIDDLNERLNEYWYYD
ncbi:MAG: hypothetical protein A2Y20_07635 [Firmicutes bacterium GWF2_51_9]|nr:MAG: hypothetical protein A2Y20_07635 [Firmicutes bacterium GWF2_51_9]OGS59427.1 MAG: hypothetical protein A2Y19_09550 [Firmicutes bacterium GWE2_51_13]HAM62763.1 hypothetical protein [Erysipelotrichaceae bacterium]